MESLQGPLHGLRLAPADTLEALRASGVLALGISIVNSAGEASEKTRSQVRSQHLKVLAPL